MTEAQWLSSTDPARMLDSLRAGMPTPGGYDMGHGLPPSSPRVAVPVSDRKLRLFACGCVRQVWHLLTDERGRNAVKVAERIAEGEGTADELDVARDAAWDAAHAAAQAGAWDAAWAAAQAKQVALLRDIFGNPWRPVPVKIFARWSGDRRPLLGQWLTWRDGFIPKLARTIYSERDFGRLPILADALEEAGCTNEEILRHCQGFRLVADEEMPNKYRLRKLDGPHVRGCWVVDLILGKN